MTKSVDHRTLAESLLLVTNSPLVIVTNDKLIQYAIYDTKRGYFKISDLIGSTIDSIVEKETLDQLSRTKSVTFSVTAKKLFLDEPKEKQFNLEMSVINDSLMILIATPFLENKEINELLPRVHYLASMILSEHDNAPQLPQTIIGSVILSEAKEILKEIDRLVND